MSETRDRIAAHVRKRPGVHFNELVRTLDLAPGQVQYHVRKLLGDDLRSEEVAGRTHYFPPEYDPWERRALALLRRETAGDVVGYLLEHGTTRPDEVTEDLSIARSTLEWHCDRLVDAGLVEKRRDDRGRVSLATPHPEATLELLETADPSLGERMVDRFTRLVDGLLEE